MQKNAVKCMEEDIKVYLIVKSLANSHICLDHIQNKFAINLDYYIYSIIEGFITNIAMNNDDSFESLLSKTKITLNTGYDEYYKEINPMLYTELDAAQNFIKTQNEQELQKYTESIFEINKLLNNSVESVKKEYSIAE